MADIVSDLGVNLLEEEIDEVIFQTNQFLTDHGGRHGLQDDGQA